MHLLQTEFTQLFSLAVLHFLWLAIIPWILWKVVESMWLKDAHSGRYFGNIICMFAFVLTIPIAVSLSTTNTAKTSTALQTAANGSSVAIQESQSASSTSTSGPKVESTGQNRPIESSAEYGQPILETAIGHWTEAASPFVFFAYLMGVIVFSIRFANGFRRARSMRQQASELSDHAIAQLADQVARRLRLKTTPLILWCEETAVPMVVGVLRPVVLVPLQLATEATSQKLEHILLHELFHIKRWDPAINCFQNIVETLLFFHPLVWIVSRKARLLREISCDSEVIKHGIDAHQYAKTLTEVADSARNRIQNPTLAVQATSGKTALRQRVEQLLNRNNRSSSTDAFTMTTLAVATTLLLGLTFLPGLLVAQQDQTELSIEEKMARLSSLPENEFAGFVKDEDGKPIAGATVDAWHWSPGTETVTDSEGFFHLKPFRKKPTHRIEVRITKPGYAPYYNHLQKIGQKDFTVTLNQSTFVEGIVKDADGTPVADTKVVFDQGSKRADGVVISSVLTIAKTDDSGKYRAYLAPDSYTIKVQCAAGTATASATVDEGKSSTLDLDLKQGAKFVATVVDSETGKPVEGFVLFRWREPKLTAISDEDGKIVIEGLINGPMEFNVGHGEPQTIRGKTYYLHGNMGRWWSEDSNRKWERRTVDDSGWQRNFDGLEFEIKNKMAPVKIVVEQGVTFSGRVLDPDGKPVAGATVGPAKTGSGNSLTGDTRYSVKTKDDGSYQVVMPAGNKFEYNLIAHDGDYQQWRKWANGVSETIKTKPGQSIDNFDLKLTRGGTIRGFVTNFRKGLKVQAAPADLLSNRYYVPTADVDEDGSFEIKFVRPGETFVQVSPFWLHAKDAPDGSSAKVDVEAEKAVEGISLDAVER